MMRSRARRSGGMPWAATMSSVPRIVHMPRFEARMTIGEIRDSRARFRYVKHSISSMCTCKLRSSDVYLVLCQYGHTYLIDEEHTRDQFCYTLIDVLADDFIDLLSEFVRNFRHFWFHQLAHHAHNVLSSLWPRIRNIEIM